MSIYSKLQFYVLVLLAGASLAGCQGSEGQALERRLANVERQDSLFMGFYFGMPRQEFYEYSWQLNQQQLVREGPQNRTVEYQIEGVEPALVMNFYPEFYQDVIYKMPVFFHHPGWAPWNKELWSDELLPKVVALMEKWYGPGFEKKGDPQSGGYYQKIDGNRRISVGLQDEQHVKVVFTDLIAQLKIDKETEQRLEEHMEDAHQGEDGHDHAH